jgi:branched-chain amino acid transport system ATP-binding protein
VSGCEPGLVGSTAEELLRIAGLEVRYGDVAAVRDLSFSVGRGEVVGVVGPNGAGKSTTLHAIMGVVPAAAGTVTFRGERITGLKPEAIARSGVALVPEGRHIFPHFTVKENLDLGLIGRRSKDGAARDMERVLDLFPILRDFRARQAGVLSGGQQQQLAIARALVAGPELLLLDEPSLGLAPTVVDLVFDTLDEVRAAGVSIVLVEQRAQLTIEFADRTHVLANGAHRMTLSPDDAGDEALMAAAYFGD